MLDDVPKAVDGDRGTGCCTVDDGGGGENQTVVT